MNLRQAKKSVRKTIRQQRLLTKEFRAVVVDGVEWRPALRQFVVGTPEYVARQSRMERARIALNRRVVRALRQHQAGTKAGNYGIELAHASVGSDR